MLNRRAGLLSCALFLLFLLGGCATSPQTRLLLDDPPDIPQRVELDQVPFYPQLQYHCGPAALAAVMNYHGVAAEPAQIADLVYVPELEGSLQVEVVAATRQFDLLPVQLDGRLESLLREVAAGNPVFVLQNLGLDIYPVWHYEILIGYNFDTREMILRSGTNRRVGRSFKLFEKTWQRAGYWALAVVPTDSVPVTASADAYLDAVIGMEQVGRIETANGAYGTALRRWPDSWLAHSGFGNTAYVMGEFPRAEAAYRKALSLQPDRAEIWNNLAYTLAQLGRHEASMDAIRRALELDPDNQNLLDSRDELSNWQ
ncbi:MAG: tetratricopeptide repeat protein [Gammaproteobacteria bacterium]|nr:MAG: tetratricopeptide repeat protein [Gammaproteobacteria bacterium]